jgi:hypothetical protein
MGSAGSTIATNVVTNIVNSLTSIVNNSAMQCVNEFQALQLILLKIDNVPPGTNVFIDQEIVAQVGAECMSNISTIAEASTDIYQEISQIAEAIMKGGRGTAEAYNITAMVTNLATTVVNTYTVDCANQFTSKQAIVAEITYMGQPTDTTPFPEVDPPFPGDELVSGNSTISVNQSADLVFVGECILNSTNVLTAASSLTQIIEQYAKAEQSSVIGQVAWLIIAIGFVLFVILFFGRKFFASQASLGFFMGLAFVVLLFTISVFVWYFGFWAIDLFMGQVEAKYAPTTPYDVGKWKENLEDGDGFDCSLAEGYDVTRVGGFSSCVSRKGLMEPGPKGGIFYPGASHAPEGTPVGTYSINCMNDTFDFNNQAVTAEYFKRNPKFITPVYFDGTDWGIPENGNFETIQDVQNFLNDSESPGLGLCCAFNEDEQYTTDYKNPYRCIETKINYQTAWQKAPHNADVFTQPTVDPETGGYVFTDGNPYEYKKKGDQDIALIFEWNEFQYPSNKPPQYYADLINKEDPSKNDEISDLVKNYMRLVVKRAISYKVNNSEIVNGTLSDSIYNKVWYGRDGELRLRNTDGSSDKSSYPAAPLRSNAINIVRSKRNPPENLRSWTCWNGTESVIINQGYAGQTSMPQFTSNTDDMKLRGDNTSGTRQCVYDQNWDAENPGFKCIEYEYRGYYYPSMCCKRTQPTTTSNECTFTQPIGDPYTCEEGTLTSFCDYCLNYNPNWTGDKKQDTYSQTLKANANTYCYRYLNPTPLQRNGCWWEKNGHTTDGCFVEGPDAYTTIERYERK